jgi:hypothetical protein
VAGAPASSGSSSAAADGAQARSSSGLLAFSAPAVTNPDG